MTYALLSLSAVLIAICVALVLLLLVMWAYPKGK